MDDQTIIDLYWQRSDDAIPETDAKYGPYCYTVANRILDSREDSEECVNDTWLRAWNAMPPQRPGALKLFLAAITRNLSFDRAKARLTARRGGGVLEVALDELSECVIGCSGVEDAAIADALAASVNAFLAAQEPRVRSIFLRRYFFLESAAEIGRTCGMTANAVSVSLHRTRARLCVHLKKEGFLE